MVENRTRTQITDLADHPGEVEEIEIGKMRINQRVRGLSSAELDMRVRAPKPDPTIQAVRHDTRPSGKTPNQPRPQR